MLTTMDVIPHNLMTNNFSRVDNYGCHPSQSNDMYTVIVDNLESHKQTIFLVKNTVTITNSLSTVKHVSSSIMSDI